jgi:branched-chain amino acid transport system substrate-binding protein
MRRMSAKFLVCVLAIAIGCNKEQQGGGNVGAADTAVIKIGEVGSMTGTEATFGTSAASSSRPTRSTRADQGKQPRVSLPRDREPEEAATAATRLISSERVAALLGEVASTRSLFGRRRRGGERRWSRPPPQQKVTAVGDYTSGACFIDPFRACDGEVRHRLKRRRPPSSVVRNDYSVGWLRFNDNFIKMGGQIVDNQSYQSGDVDFKAQLTNIKAAKPQALYVPGYYTDVGLIARQAREVGLTVPLLGGDGWDSEKLYEIGGSALEGSYFSNHYSVDDPSPRIQEFSPGSRRTAGGSPTRWRRRPTTAGMLYDAMKRADLTDFVVRRRCQTKDYKGVTGDITMDDKRNATKPAVVLKVAKGGKYEFAGRIQPEGVKEASPAEAPREPKKTEGNTAPNPAPGMTPTPTQAPAPGATTSAQAAANTGQHQGVPAGEHPKK